MGRADSGNWLFRMIFYGPEHADWVILDRWPTIERSLSRLVGYFAMLFVLMAGLYLLFG